MRAVLPPGRSISSRSNAGNRGHSTPFSIICGPTSAGSRPASLAPFRRARNAQPAKVNGWRLTIPIRAWREFGNRRHREIHRRCFVGGGNGGLPCHVDVFATISRRHVDRESGLAQSDADIVTAGRDRAPGRIANPHGKAAHHFLSIEAHVEEFEAGKDSRQPPGGEWLSRGRAIAADEPGPGVLRVVHAASPSPARKVAHMPTSTTASRTSSHRPAVKLPVTSRAAPRRIGAEPAMR